VDGATYMQGIVKIQIVRVNHTQLEQPGWHFPEFEAYVGRNGYPGECSHRIINYSQDLAVGEVVFHLPLIRIDESFCLGLVMHHNTTPTPLTRFEPRVDQDLVVLFGTDIPSSQDTRSFDTVTFHVDGTTMYASKTILSLRCEHFMEMFSNKPADKAVKVVDVKGTPAETFAKILFWIYASQADIPPIASDDFRSFYMAADEYLLTDLILLLERELAAKLTIANVTSILFGFGYLYQNLRCVMVAFARANIEKVGASEDMRYILARWAGFKPFADLLAEIGLIIDGEIGRSVEREISIES